MYKYYNQTIVAAAAPSAAMETENHSQTAQFPSFATNGTNFHQFFTDILVAISEICGKIGKNLPKIKYFFLVMKNSVIFAARFNQCFWQDEMKNAPTGAERFFGIAFRLYSCARFPQKTRLYGSHIKNKFVSAASSGVVQLVDMKAWKPEHSGLFHAVFVLCSLKFCK